MYYCSSQKQIQIFNTSDIYNWVLHQSINANGSHWTICDFDLSPDQKYLIFSTLDSNLQLVSIDSEDKEYSSLNGEDAGGQVSFSTSTANYGILCVRFSGQGNSVIAGTNQHSIENYDLVKRQNVSSIVRAHSDEVNSVNFVDIEKSDVIVSGSDEACIKVWDLRCINSNQSPQGVLIGHKEGVTYISPKLDGVHLISNSKDQTIKL